MKEYEMDPDAFPRMVGDVGGTNARWAVQQVQNGPLTHVSSYAVEDFESIQASIEHFLADHACPRPRELAIGVATAVTGDQIQFTNSPWSFSLRALQAALGVQRLVVLNDFEALAMSLPWLQESGLRRLGQVEADSANRRKPAVVVGPGTGLGVAALVWQGSDSPVVVSGEGGHATLAASNDLQAEILRWLRQEFEHVSAERVLSGAGLVNLYRALCAIDGIRAESVSPAEVVSHGADRRDTRCVHACDLFTEFLGSVAGNLALAYGARGGVYLGGGIVPRLGAAFDVERFRRAFEGKGRLRPYLSDIPCWLITEAQPALIGASRALADAPGNSSCGQPSRADALGIMRLADSSR